MKQKYKDWINKYYPTRKKAANNCDRASQEMATAFFLELTLQIGLANDILHCWCIDETGNIIDPTEIQFDLPITYHKIGDNTIEKTTISDDIFMRNCWISDQIAKHGITQIIKEYKHV